MLNFQTAFPVIASLYLQIKSMELSPFTFILKNITSVAST